MKVYTLLALACLCASGCGRKPLTVAETQVIEVPVVETVPVPEALLRPCQAEVLAVGASNMDLERFAAESHVCNLRHEADKAAIRELQ